MAFSHSDSGPIRYIARLATSLFVIVVLSTSLFATSDAQAQRGYDDAISVLQLEQPPMFCRAELEPIERPASRPEVRLARRADLLRLSMLEPVAQRVTHRRAPAAPRPDH
jgi:hypothetical protein